MLKYTVKFSRIFLISFICDIGGMKMKIWYGLKVLLLLHLDWAALLTAWFTICAARFSDSAHNLKLPSKDQKSSTSLTQINPKNKLQLH